MDILANDKVDIDTFCRLCGSEEGIRVSIFEAGTEHVKKIHKILPITVNEHDPFPKTMCHRCSFKVNEFFEFRTTCLKAQEMFKSKVPWLRDKQDISLDNNHPPMVEVPMNSVNAVSPNEQQVVNKPIFIDENDPMIVIEDDSCEEGSTFAEPLISENGPRNKVMMRITRSDIKKKSKSRCVWDTKKRKKRSRKCYKITEVYTTSLDEYQKLDNIENDPLCISPTGNNDIKPNYSYPVKSPKLQNESNNTENSVLTNDKAGEHLTLPKHILVTNIPRVGYVYTCENCGRTFLSPQPASTHMCDTLDCGQDIRLKEEEHNLPPSDTVDYYNCDDCNQVFSRHSQLITHLKKHTKEESSSDDNFTPFNHRKKPQMKKKNRPTLLRPKTFLTSFNEGEPGIARHSLLSSDSE